MLDHLLSCLGKRLSVRLELSLFSSESLSSWLLVLFQIIFFFQSSGSSSLLLGTINIILW